MLMPRMPGRPCSAQQAFACGFESLVVEAQAIDDGAVFAQAEDARLGISVLRARRDGAGFDEAETETEHGLGDFGVLVEAGGEADGVGEIEAQYFDAQARVVAHLRWRSVDQAKRFDRQAVGKFRIEAAQDRPRQGKKRASKFHRDRIGLTGSTPTIERIARRRNSAASGEGRMLSHKQIWGAIDTLASRYGHSASGLARAAGLDPTTFNKSKRLGPQGRLRWPSTESLSKILQVTGASLDDFVAFISRGAGSAGGRRGSCRLLKLKDAAKKQAFDAQGRPMGKAWDQIRFSRSRRRSRVRARDLKRRGGAGVSDRRRGRRVACGRTCGATTAWW